MTTYEVGTNDRGDIGYVTCEDEWAQRLLPWYPYVVIGGDWIDLPSEPYRMWAEEAVTRYLERDGAA